MSTDQPGDDGFTRAVETYIRLGAPERRGLSAEEYRARCRQLWDACPTSDRLPWRVLVDRLLTLDQLQSEAKFDYEDIRVREGVDVHEFKWDWYCGATGLIQSDGTPVGRDGRTKRSDDEAEEPQVQQVALALFDVLGFGARMASDGLARLMETYSKLIARVLVVEELRCNALLKVDEATYNPAMFTLPVRYAYFSDTLLLWVPLAQYYVAPFLGRCAEFVCAAIEMGVPVRGAISIGPAALHRPTSTYLGEPLVEAARLEAAQEWLGAALGRSTTWPPFVHELDPRLVVPIVPPHKPGAEEWLGSLVLDWPRRWRDTRAFPVDEAISSMNVAPERSKYYDAAASFARFSQEKQDWYQAPATRVWEEPGDFVSQVVGPTAVFNQAGEVVVVSGRGGDV